MSKLMVEYTFRQAECGPCRAIYETQTQGGVNKVCGVFGGMLNWTTNTPMRLPSCLRAESLAAAYVELRKEVKDMSIGKSRTPAGAFLALAKIEALEAK